jgi:nucleotide-binding universal stress UspA family protein
MFTKILVAVHHLDPDASEVVFDRALSLAQAMKAKLIVFSAITIDTASYLNSPIYPGGESFSINEAAMRVYLEQQQQEQERNKQFLNALVDRGEALGVDITMSLQMGDPGNQICEVAKTEGVDTIVVGRRGHSGLNELLMGSVSNYVLHHAPCSVLVVQGVTKSAVPL